MITAVGVVLVWGVARAVPVFPFWNPDHERKVIPIDLVLCCGFSGLLADNSNVRER